MYLYFTPLHCRFGRHRWFNSAYVMGHHSDEPFMIRKCEECRKMVEIDIDHVERN